jgi:GlcNAc-P-P-Und epimerase
VTGGSGFIGTSLVPILLAQGYEVLNLDIRPPLDRRQDTCWECGDILDGAFLMDQCRIFGPTLCIHLAAETEILEGADVESDFAVNVRGAPILLRALDSVDCQRAVMVSTQFVFGPGIGVPTGPTDWRPHTAYGESKVRMEKCVRGFSGGVKWTIVRPSYVWGPWHQGGFRQLARTIGRRVYLHPAGKVVRSYGYVETVCEQMVLLSRRREAEGQTVYVGDATIDSAEFVDCLSLGLTGRPSRRMPVSALRLLANLGEWSGLIPLDRFRYRNMTTDYPVPMEPTFALVGKPTISLEVACSRYAAWARADRE